MKTRLKDSVTLLKIVNKKQAKRRPYLHNIILGDRAYDPRFVGIP